MNTYEVKEVEACELEWEAFWEWKRWVELLELRETARLLQESKEQDEN